MSKTLIVVPENNQNNLLMDFLKDSALSSSSLEVMIASPDESVGPISTLCASLEIPIHFLSSNNRAVCIFKFLKLVKERKICSVVFHSFPLFYLLVASFVFRRRVKRYFVRHHNLNHHLKDNKKAILIDCINTILSTKLIAVSETVAATTKDELGVLQSFLKNRVQVIQNGVNLNRFEISPFAKAYTGGSFRMLAVGRLDWQKNYPLMLESLSNLKNDGFHFELVVLGTGPKSQTVDFERMLKMYELNSCVKLLGHVENVGPYLNSCHLFLHTAADEACSLALIEAMLFGVPIVVSPCGGSAEMAERFELHTARSAVEFNLRIQEVIENYHCSVIHALSIRRKAASFYSNQKYWYTFSDLLELTS